MDIVKSYHPKTVLDVGCGLGHMVKEMIRQGIDAHGIDFSIDLIPFWKDEEHFSVRDATNLKGFADSSYDLVISSDFFEHVPEENIDAVANEMRRVSKEAIFTVVADDRGAILSPRQKLYHCTHKSLDWWNKRLTGIDVFSSHDL